MRIKEDYEGQLTDMDQEKVELIRRLTDAIRELDSLNQEKGELNDKLITLFKFTRDVERQTLRSEDLMTVVDESLKEELKSEKQQGICLREQIKMLESERFHVRDKVLDTDCLQEQF
jgi:chromosome segregation ATPase